MDVLFAPVHAVLDSKTLAVYGMTVRRGSEARQRLEKLFPRARVDVCNDPDSSDRLVRLARQAEVFVVNTWDAKHAATCAIKDNRRADKVTLFPRSKTVTSMVGAVTEWARQQPLAR
jgi:hypothetical protein